MRRQFLFAVCLLSVAVSAPVLSATPAPIPGLGGQAVCASTEQTPAPLFKTQLDCFEGPCFTASDCWSACPQAVTASCVSDSCQYTFYTPGGGGGTGGGGTGGPGTECFEAACFDSSQCGVCNGRQGVCVNDSCQY